MSEGKAAKSLAEIHVTFDFDVNENCENEIGIKPHLVRQLETKRNGRVKDVALIIGTLESGGQLLGPENLRCFCWIGI